VGQPVSAGVTTTASAAGDGVAVVAVVDVVDVVVELVGGGPGHVAGSHGSWNRWKNDQASSVALMSIVV